MKHHNLRILIILLVLFSASYLHAAINFDQQISAYDAAKSEILRNMAENSSYSILQKQHYQTISRLSKNINRNRYYSPALGRFTSKDPIGFNGDINLYRYANCNPVLHTDPYGEKIPPFIKWQVTFQELTVGVYIHTVFSSVLVPTCNELCPGYGSTVPAPPPLSGAYIVIYKPTDNESAVDVFENYGLITLGDCAYGVTRGPAVLEN